MRIEMVASPSGKAELGLVVGNRNKVRSRDEPVIPINPRHRHSYIRQMLKRHDRPNHVPGLATEKAAAIPWQTPVSILQRKFQRMVTRPIVVHQVLVLMAGQIVSNSRLQLRIHHLDGPLPGMMIRRQIAGIAPEAFVVGSHKRECVNAMTSRHDESTHAIDKRTIDDSVDQPALLQPRQFRLMLKNEAQVTQRLLAAVPRRQIIAQYSIQNTLRHQSDLNIAGSATYLHCVCTGAAAAAGQTRWGSRDLAGSSRLATTSAVHSPASWMQA
ncbi:MAG: hypothetical protein VKI83_08765 [Synechococcaceae cyanobacterium]|nr:hypothetical protein [Synechococcaceae cyanobacterium]